jgi:hypothetical protein
VEWPRRYLSNRDAAARARGVDIIQESFVNGKPAPGVLVLRDLDGHIVVLASRAGEVG